MSLNRKICVLGYRGVGKSVLITQFTENHFVDSYTPTIENTVRKNLRYHDRDYLLEILDTAGQEKYSFFQNRWAVGFHGYIFVYSVNHRASFEVLRDINQKLLESLGTKTIPRVVVGTKTDLGDRKVSKEEGKALATEWGCAFVECSGKNNENIDEVFTTMISEIEQETTPTTNERVCKIL